MVTLNISFFFYHPTQIFLFEFRNPALKILNLLVYILVGPMRRLYDINVPHNKHNIQKGKKIKKK